MFIIGIFLLLHNEKISKKYFFNAIGIIIQIVKILNSPK